MNRLLLEYLNKILYEYTDEEKRKLGIPLDAEARGGYWYRGDVYIGKVRDGKFLPAGTGELPDSSIRPPGEEEDLMITPSDKYDSARALVNLKSIAVKLKSLRSQGIAGAGGAAASWGELLFTQFGSMFQQNERGVLGVIEETSDNPKFEQIASELASVDESKRKTKLKQERKLRETVAKDFGFTNYNDMLPAHRERVAKYLATREIYSQNELEEARSQCKKDPNSHVFCKKGTTGFGSNEGAYRNWLEAAFDGAARLDALIRSGGTRIDPSKEWVAIQSDVSDKAREEGYSPEESLLNTLVNLRDSATTDEDREHYDYQITLFEKLAHRDTMIVGQDSRERMVVIHDSNKQSSDMGDPHMSSTPEAKLRDMKRRYEEDPLLTPRERKEFLDATEQVVNILDDALETVTDIKSVTIRSAIGLEITDDMITLAESSYMESYMNVLAGLAENRKKGFFGAWLQQQVPPTSWENMDTRKKLQAGQGYLRDNPSGAYSSFGYLFIKMGQFAENGKVLQDVFGETTRREELAGPTALRAKEKDSIGETYKSVVGNLKTSDENEGHQPPPPNGRHVQTYVGSVMDSLHIDLYIDNYDEDNVVSMGSHAVTPREVRDTLMKILPEEFTSTIDINTRQGREALKKYLRENSIVNAETGGLIISTPDGECSIGEDSWRTAGKSPKVSTKFGTCFRQNLREETSKKPVDFL